MIEKLADAMAADMASEEAFMRGDNKAGWQHLARAVLEALREPTFELKMAGAEAITADTMKAMANYDGAIQCWQAMIDAALNDKH